MNKTLVGFVGAILALGPMSVAEAMPNALTRTAPLSDPAVAGSTTREGAILEKAGYYGYRRHYGYRRPYGFRRPYYRHRHFYRGYGFRHRGYYY